MRCLARLLIPVAVAAVALPSAAAAQFKLTEPATSFDRPVFTGVVPYRASGYAVPYGHSGGMMTPGYRPGYRRVPQQPQWQIPPGKYGLQLADGTRMIGQPASGWSATLKATYGTIAIPLTQIANLVPAGNGQFAAYLKNGDRVTGTLVSTTLQFETQFGTLTVATMDVVRLVSANSPPVPQTAGAAGPIPRGPGSVVPGGTSPVYPRPGIGPGSFDPVKPGPPPIFRTRTLRSRRPAVTRPVPDIKKR